jgi:hypothetical protein
MGRGNPVLVIVAAIVGAIVMILGLLGSVLPVLPGPPLSFAGLFLMALVQDFSHPLTPALVIVMAVITVVVTALDYFVPWMGAKRYGASRGGVWGSIVGMIVGIFFFPPFGMFIGALIGAILGEFVAGKKTGDAMRAGWGVYVGTMAGIVIKLGACGVMTYYFVVALI